MPESQSQEIDSNDVLKILIATDNHLGYSEKDAVRGEDSFTAFEEILELATEHDVDFILLGGDLFHDSAPSQNSLHKCLKLLRRYTLGDKPIPIEFLSDQSMNFHEALHQTVNYEDPNLNVSIPIFSIHGNHDDPSGFGRLSSLDLLSTTGLINYFGRWTDLTKIEISPILLKKGETQIALYGLSHIHDSRLARLFQNGKVIIEKPDPSTGEWFNLMVLHQNRADRGPKNYLPEDILPDFLDLIIWGHEHDCRIVPEVNVSKNFYVCQPGSSVPTSLAEGEAIPKHVGLLLVHKTQFKMEPIPLKTVRPFVFESISLSDYIEEYALDEGDASNKVMQLAKSKIEMMIQRATDMYTEHPKQPKLPLIRLRIIYNNEEQMFNAIRFGQQYNEKIANPTDIVLFKKQIKRTKLETKEFDKAALDSALNKMDVDTETRVEDVVDRYFDEVDETKKLQLISSKILSEMCYRLVERSDANAAESIIHFYKEKAVEHLMKKLPDEDSVHDEIFSFKSNASLTHESVLKMLDDRSTNSIGKDSSRDNDNNTLFIPPMDTSKSSLKGKKAPEEKSTTATTRGRARGRGRGSRSGGAFRAMPELDVTVSSRNTTRQQSLLDALGQNNSASSNRRGKNKAPVYEISDDSD